MNRIRQLREEQKWSQGELGKRIGVQISAVSKYELGKSSLSDEMIVTLCGVFDVSADYLLGLSDERGKNKKAPLPPPIEQGLSAENIEELKKYAELLRLKQKAEEDSEFSSGMISNGTNQ